MGSWLGVVREPLPLPLGLDFLVEPCLQAALPLVGTERGWCLRDVVLAADSPQGRRGLPLSSPVLAPAALPSLPTPPLGRDLAQEGPRADQGPFRLPDAGQARHHSACERADADPGRGGRDRPGQAEEVHRLLPRVSPGTRPWGRAGRAPLGWERAPFRRPETKPSGLALRLPDRHSHSLARPQVPRLRNEGGGFRI